MNVDKNNNKLLIHNDKNKLININFDEEVNNFINEREIIVK